LNKKPTDNLPYKSHLELASLMESMEDTLDSTSDESITDEDRIDLDP